MSPFWTGFCEQLKDCGRGTKSFVLAVLTLLALFIAGVIAEKVHASLQVLVGILLLSAVWVAIAARRAWKRRRDRLEFSRLSSDELVRARSKLKNGFAPMNQFKPARFERPPDTDLKF